jgi:hypothetical protein
MRINHEPADAAVRRAIAAGDDRPADDLAKAFRVKPATVKRIRREMAAAKQRKLFE